MTYEEIRHSWNAQADDGNGWYSLSEYEKVEWAASIGAATERAARKKAQEEVVFLKERIARAGVEQRRALHEALQQERVPLTDEAIRTLYGESDGHWQMVGPQVLCFARSIESAHGIQEQST